MKGVKIFYINRTLRMKLNSQKNQIAVKSQLWTWQITELFSGGNTCIKDFYFI